MRRVLAVFGLAVAGLVLAVGLTLGAYAVAGRDLSRPAQPVRLPARLAPVEASVVPTPSRSSDDRTVDDKGGDRDGRSSNSGRGSDSSGSGSSGSGSGRSGSDDD